jgi:hypothetical protein
MKQSRLICFLIPIVAGHVIQIQDANAQEATVAKAVATAESASDSPNSQSPAPQTESTAQEATESDKSTALSLPYQGIYRSVPQDKLDTATALLQKELQVLDSLNIIRGAVASPDAKSPKLDEYRASVESANQAENARQIAPALQARKKALASLEKNAGAMPAHDASEYLQAHHELARTLMLAGDDARADKTIKLAARLAPTYPLNKQIYSRIYQKHFKTAADQAIADRRGSIMVKSILPGANIELDGRPTGVAPILLEKVVPGRHLIVARIDGVIPFSTVINVAAKQEAKVVARYGNTAGGDEVGAVAEALSTNKLPKAMVASAVKASKAVGAEWVIFGAIAKADDKFRVHTYLLKTDTQKIKVLQTVNFDLELLTAESDVLRIVQDASASIADFDGADTEITLIEKRMRAKSTVTRFNASPDYVDYSARGKSKSKKKIKRTVFRPLKGGKITIKDEEE